MPMVYRKRLISTQRPITQMTLRELIDYEAYLWRWMDRAKSPVNIALELNTIHREIEWRSQEAEWQQPCSASLPAKKLAT